MWGIRARIGQLVSYLSVVPMSLGAFSLVFGDFSVGMYWLLAGSALAGLAFGWRVPLMARDAGTPAPGDHVGTVWSWRLDPDSAPPIRTLVRDLLISWLAFAVILLVSALVEQVASGDGGFWQVFALVLFVPVLGAGGGILVGLLLIGPIWDVVIRRRELQAEPAAFALSIVIAVLMLLIVASAITGVLSVHLAPSVPYPFTVSRTLFVVITGHDAYHATLIDPGLASISRILLLLVFVIAPATTVLGGRAIEQRRVRQSRAHDPAAPSREP